MEKKKTSLQKSQALSTVSPLQVYMQEVMRHPLLEPEEEFELAKSHFDDGDVAAAHRLVTSNLRLVVKIAHEFSRTSANLLDLIQEGNYGLMQAVKKYNPYRGVKLSSYAAWWIRAYILKYLLDNRGQVKIATTAAQRKVFYNLQKETERLIAQGQEVDPKLIAKSLDVQEKDVVEMQKRMGAADLPLDAPYLGSGDDANASARSEYFADTQESIDDLLADKQVKFIFSQYLKEFRETLHGRDLEILNDRMISEKPMTLQEIGNRYGISRERARQIEARIVTKLKAFVKEKGTLDI